MLLVGPFKKVESYLNERLFIGACLFANVILVGTFQVCTLLIQVSGFLDCFCNTTFSNGTLEFFEECAYNGHSFRWHSHIATAWWSRFVNRYVVWFAEKSFRFNGECIWRTKSKQSGNSFAATKIYSYQFNKTGSWSSCIWSKYLLHWTFNRCQSDTQCKYAILWNFPCLWLLITYQMLMLLSLSEQYKYRANDGSSPLHIIEECLRTFYLAYIVKKGSVLQPLFSIHVQRLFEGGFVTFWYDYIEHAITTHRRYIRLLLQNEQHGLSLIDLQIAFFILFIGLLTSLILFVIEIAVYRYKKREPNGIRECTKQGASFKC